ncbi:hypothetical protein [Bailinhaonella thermotolerans]|uniref:Uncharacterized protein n=1 Tax=Bailinhaonella thermotolerans TaxID=1070861 RepID=A0A3A4A134_9ACTN|nr:hypothetical protein [Bailinhaonella thermotolerans]RJL22109.1 hypothetical protein D5H75_36585 [Bailinhaonella thermotolerans]
MMLALIAACEIGFWVVLGAALAARYLLRWRTVSTVLLISLPVIDLILLAATVVDVRGGATASYQHALAAAYLGFTVMFGHRTVRWADQRFAHRFAGGPPPWKPPSGGWPRARYEWVFWIRLVLAYVITTVILAALIRLIDDPSRTQALTDSIQGLAKVPLIAAIWPVSYTYSALRAQKTPDQESQPH